MSLQDRAIIREDSSIARAGRRRIVARIAIKRETMMSMMASKTKALVTAAMLSAQIGPVLAETTAAERRRRGEDTIRTLNLGRTQPTLEGLRREFPFLADALTDYALGDVWSRSELDHRTRQLAAVAAFAALGNQPFLRIHAGYALNLGASEADLKEIVYLTTVPAGFPKAIAAAQTLIELFNERRGGTGARP